MIYSMTGFSKIYKIMNWGKLEIQIKSLNHRYLELSFNIQDFLKDIEYDLRKMIRMFIQRGKIEIIIYIHFEKMKESLEINIPLAKKILKAEKKLADNLKISTSLDACDLILLPNIIIAKKNQKNIKYILNIIPNLFKKALKELQNSRLNEGNILLNILYDKSNKICSILDKIKNRIPNFHKKYSQNILKKISEIQINNSINFEKEIINLLRKIDINEELERIKFHIKEVLTIINNKDETYSGKKLDFIMQELNREANTLASKSIDYYIIKLAIEIKILIEQMREQIQNIE